MPVNAQLHRQNNAQTLIGMLVTLVIIAVLAGAFLIGYRHISSQQQQQKQTQTTLGAVMDRGKSVECLNNLQQIRQLITMYQIEHDANPPNLTALNLPAGIQARCPVTGAGYIYDPRTGRVTCPRHPKY